MRIRNKDQNALFEKKAGSFVVQYVGEVITSEEAEVRGKKYDAGNWKKSY